MNKTTDSSLNEQELLAFVKLVRQHYREAKIKLTPEIVERMDDILAVPDWCELHSFERSLCPHSIEHTSQCALVDSLNPLEGHCTCGAAGEETARSEGEK